MSWTQRFARAPMIGVAFRNPHYGRLWSAQAVSLLGDWLNRVAGLSLITSLAGEKAATGVGLLFALEVALRLMPITLLGPFAGPVVDRLPRKLIMLGADALRALIVLGFLFIDQPSHLPFLYALIFTQMAVAIFFDAANSASIANLVPKDEYHEAYALAAITWSTMLTVGALLGGVLVVGLGIDGAYLCDVGTYLCSLAIISRIRLPKTESNLPPFRWKRILHFEEMRAGLHHVREHGLTPVIFAKAAWASAVGFLVILAIAAKESYALSATKGGLVLGILYSARGLGTGIGPLLARRFLGTDEKALKKHIQIGLWVGIAGYAFFPLFDNLAAAALCVAIAHFGGSALWVASTTWYQRRIDDAFRGRVFALEFLLMTLSSTAGGLIAGLSFDLSGDLRLSSWVVCGCVGVGAALWSLAARELPGPQPLGSRS